MNTQKNEHSLCYLKYYFYRTPVSTDVFLTQTVQFLYPVYVYFIPGSLISYCDAPITLKSCWHTQNTECLFYAWGFFM